MSELLVGIELSLLSHIPKYSHCNQAETGDASASSASNSDHLHSSSAYGSTIRRAGAAAKNTAKNLSVGRARRGDLDQAIRSLRDGQRRHEQRSARGLDRIFLDGSR
jgi:hypothetical protein